MRWLRKLLGLCVHDWGAVECIRIPAAEWVSHGEPKRIIHSVGRHTHARWCSRCGNYKMVYGVECHVRANN